MNLLNRVLENPLLRRVLKNSGYLFSAAGVTAFLSMLQSILAGRLLGVEGFGLLGVITMFASVVNKLASFRMGELVIKYVGRFTEEGDHSRAAAVFKAAALSEMLASLVAFGLIWLLSPLGARYFAKDAALAPWFAFYGLAVVANLIAESSTGLLQFFDRYRRMALLHVAQSLVTLALIALAYFTSGGLQQALLAYLAGKVVGALGLSLTALGEARRRWGVDWFRAPLGLLRPQAGELARFAVNTNLSASLSLINKDSELLWVSLFRGPLETGYYKTALAIINIVQLPVSPLPQATFPELSRAAARGDWDAMRRLMRQGSLLAGGFTLAAGLALALIGRPLILLLYHKSEFLPAYPALLILLTGYLAANTLYWARPALLALGQAGYATRINALVTAVKTAGVLVLLPTIGYLGSPIMLAVSYWLGTALSARRARGELHRRQAGA
ncbi:MAG: oligosaccharide flippase family protein [Chloroflexi bacterium]|nr:oligosaccharide flippase family protein [Chloroflexota bacterium]